jgi:hypothetical protein
MDKTSTRHRRNKKRSMEQMTLRKGLLGVLVSSNGERAVMDFLTKHPELVRWSFCTPTGHGTYVVKEFPFGNHFRADLVVLDSDSGGWDVYFVELEPVGDSVINKDGTFSRRLNKAIAQVNEWKDYVRQYPHEVRRDLSFWLQKHDLLRLFGDDEEIRKGDGDSVRDLVTFVQYHFFIIIGRRTEVRKDQRQRMNQLSIEMNTQIYTYDRFVEVASEVDKKRAAARREMSPEQRRTERLLQELEDVLEEEEAFISKLQKMKHNQLNRRRMRRFEAEFVRIGELSFKSVETLRSKNVISNILERKCQQAVENVRKMSRLVKKFDRKVD